MRYFFLILLSLVYCVTTPEAWADELLVEAAQERLKVFVRYDGAYVGLDYPNGDVPAGTGVCSDVIIRSYRAAYGFDFQKAVHEDMRENFKAYPKNWGLTRPDKNIDHRRVPNLETYLKRHGKTLPVTKKASDYKAGDIVTWRLGGRLPHIRSSFTISGWGQRKITSCSIFKSTGITALFRRLKLKCERHIARASHGIVVIALYILKAEIVINNVGLF